MGSKNIGTGTVIDQLANGEVAEPMILSDAKASAMLKGFHNSYKTLNKKRPKSPAEAVTLPLVFAGDTAALAVIDAEYTAKTNAWRESMNNLLHNMVDLGTSNPGAPISIFDEKSGRTVSKNGLTLAQALLREEAIALRGTAQ